MAEQHVGCLRLANSWVPLGLILLMFARGTFCPAWGVGSCRGRGTKGNQAEGRGANALSHGGKP
eukprot:9763145-Alexandrium_andersonii.AAC.2